jgi:hypothetical protein
MLVAMAWIHFQFIYSLNHQGHQPSKNGGKRFYDSEFPTPVHAGSRPQYSGNTSCSPSSINNIDILVGE